MAHGGPRNGSGRKPGGKNKKSREVADRAAAKGITPLEVMLKAMRQYDQEGKTDRATAVAKDAAPYCHPRLASITHEGGETPICLVITEEIVDAPDAGTPLDQDAPGAAGVS